MTADESMAIEVRRDMPEPTAVVLWGTNEPSGMVSRMGVVSSALAGVIREKRMSKRIGEREYVFVEGWSLCGAILGVFPRTSALEEMRTGDGDMFGFRATVELVTRDGGVVGGAVAICTRDEERWADREWNQIASMAQTRATAKAYRGSLGFVMQMAGYAPTPAEEMDGIETAPRMPVRPAVRRATVPHEHDAGEPTHMRNSGDFLTACKNDLGLLKTDVLRLHNVERGEDLAALMADVGSWEELLAITGRLKDAVPA